MVIPLTLISERAGDGALISKYMILCIQTFFLIAMSINLPKKEK